MSEQDVLIIRTEEEQKRSIEIHDEFRNELLKRQLSNTENYDKSILTLSSAALAISLTFFSELDSTIEASDLWMLKISWSFFLITILSAISGYLVSNKAITKQLELAHEYYIDKKHSAINAKNWFSIANNFLNVIVGVFFSLAITSTVLFITKNLGQGEPIMSTDKKSDTSPAELVIKSAVVPSMQQAPSSASMFPIGSAMIPKMSAAPGAELSINSAQVPKMQAAPGEVAQQQPTQQSLPNEKK